ncbi:MAG: hypothetical protein H6Q31_191 [Bacteroidetes bacterium]|nr:hypothetical protein [Bacteroidota bacterium]
MKRIVAIVLALAVYAGSVWSQTTPRVPRLSQGAKVSQFVGLSEVSVTYHRPGVKGRQIWGNVVKYNEAWRAGANEPTLLTLSDEVTIAGKKIGAGTYRLVVFPYQTGDWKFILNSEVKNWGSIYDPKFDTLTVAVKPEAGPHEEWMTFTFKDLTPTSARLELAWEKVRLSLPMEFNTLSKIQASVGNWQMLASAAKFAADNGMYLTEGLGWADRAIALEKNPRTLQVKAEVLAKMGKNADAIALGEEAVKLAKAKDPKANTGQLDALINEWKGKK